MALRAVAAGATLPRGAWVVGDRRSCTGPWFMALTTHGCWGLVRRNRRLGLGTQRRLRRARSAGGRLDAWLVRAGGRGAAAPAVPLRAIRWRRGATVRALLTTSLDPAQLSAVEALALSPRRGGIERLFFDLKEVRNLNRVYAANPNAVAMQVYAAGCVDTALRVAQGEVAAAAGLAPEAIAPAKFFPQDGRRLPLLRALRAVVRRHPPGEPRPALAEAPPSRSGASRRSPSTASSWSRAEVSARNAASARHGGSGSRCDMFAVVLSCSN
jgi:hypothetical protein